MTYTKINFLNIINITLNNIVWYVQIILVLINIIFNQIIIFINIILLFFYFLFFNIIYKSFNLDFILLYIPLY